MKRILVVIDMQNDFITGTLGNDDCRNAVKGCIDLCKNGNFDQIIFTRDTHQKNYLNTLEGKKLPVEHCIKGTNGWEIIPELKPYADIVVNKDTFGSVCRDNAYGGLQHMVKRYASSFPHYDDTEIHFCGVCTSICVISNMAILRAYFPNTRIVLHKNATGDVTEEMKQAAFIVAKSIQCDVED